MHMQILYRTLDLHCKIRMHVLFARLSPFFFTVRFGMAATVKSLRFHENNTKCAGTSYLHGPLTMNLM